jgi:hypothetical protein
LFVGINLKNMSFRVERNYLAIPCSITYTVYDNSMTFLMTETVTNPPGPPPTPPCVMGIPAWVEFQVSGTIFKIPINCGCVVEVWITCTPSPGFHPFRACLTPDPLGTCTNLLTIDL